MSFYIINPIDKSVVRTIQSGEHYELSASKVIYVMSRTIAIIPHQIWIRCNGPVWLSRNPGVFVRSAIWIDSGQIEDGYVSTAVFNMADTRFRLNQGDSISRLIAL